MDTTQVVAAVLATAVYEHLTSGQRTAGTALNAQTLSRAVPDIMLCYHAVLRQLQQPQTPTGKPARAR
jgi:hypothetical protein